MSHVKHGMRNTPEYRAWASMISRCHNERHASYPRYGGRGISVCDAWRASFEQFFSDVGPRPTPAHQIDRIDNDGGYRPENCRWATASENSRNRSNTHMIAFLGFNLPLAEWCERTGIPYQTLRKRLEAGWSAEEALLTPISDTLEQRSALAKGSGLGRPPTTNLHAVA